MTTSPVLPLSERDGWLADQAARRRNESAYESTLIVKELPSAHVAWEALPDRVLVSATDMNVLAEWLYQSADAARKPVSTVDLPSGQTVWTLKAWTWSDCEAFPPVPVFVTVVQPTDEPVMHEIRAAVAKPAVKR